MKTIIKRHQAAIRSTVADKKKRYNTGVILKLTEKFQVSRRFITQSLKGDRRSETSETIKKEYFSLLAKVETVLR